MLTSCPGQVNSKKIYILNSLGRFLDGGGRSQYPAFYRRLSYPRTGADSNILHLSPMGARGPSCGFLLPELVFLPCEGGLGKSRLPQHGYTRITAEVPWVSSDSSSRSWQSMSYSHPSSGDRAFGHSVLAACATQGREKPRAKSKERMSS